MSWGLPFVWLLGCPSVMGRCQPEEWLEWALRMPLGHLHLQVAFLPWHRIPSRPWHISWWLWGQARFWKTFKSNLYFGSTGKKKRERQLAWPQLRWGETGQAAHGRCPVFSTSSRSINTWHVSLPFSVCHMQLLTPLIFPHALGSWCVPLPLSSEVSIWEGSFSVWACLFMAGRQFRPPSSTLLPKAQCPHFSLWIDVKYLM